MTTTMVMMVMVMMGQVFPTSKALAIHARLRASAGSEIKGGGWVLPRQQHPKCMACRRPCWPLRSLSTLLSTLSTLLSTLAGNALHTPQRVTAHAQRLRDRNLDSRLGVTAQVPKVSRSIERYL